MKKTLGMILFVFVVVMLAGCQDNTTDVKDVTKPTIVGTKDFTLTIGDSKPNWLENILVSDDMDENVTVTVDDSNVNLNEAGSYDLIYQAVDKAGNVEKITVTVFVSQLDKSYFYLELINIDNQKLVNEMIEFDSNENTPIMDLLNDQLTLDYTSYDFGTMINGINGHYPKEYGASYNYYYSLLVDGKTSLVGIDAIDYQEEMVITFKETTMLSQLDLKVDQLIYQFIDENLENYINDQNMNHQILAAVNQMVSKNYLDLDLSSLYQFDNLDVTQLDLEDLSTAQLLKLGLYLDINEKPMTDYQTHLLTITETNVYAITSYLNALYLIDQTNDDVAKSLMSSDFIDPDFVGMSLESLSGYTHLDGFDTYLSNAISYIQSNQKKDGIEAWSNVNAASTATVIIGLVAQGIHPESDDFKIDDKGLISQLMNFEENGVFKNTLDDTDADLLFSTPQAITALILYKLSRDGWQFPSSHLYR